MDFMNTILDQLHDAAIITERSGKVIYFNKAALLMSESILIHPLTLGRKLDKLVDPTHKEFLRVILAEIVQTGKSHKTYAEFKSSTGSTNHLELVYIPIANELGEILYIGTYIRDMTAQKAFENKLATLARNTNQLIEKANALIIGLDTRGYITEWNQHCTSITGFDKNEVYARKFAEVLLREDARKDFEDLLTTVLAHQEITNYEVIVSTRDNGTATLLLNSTVRTSPSGKIIGVVLIGQDVTELAEYRKSLERKVEQRTRELKAALEKEKDVVEMRSRFVSIASHEFRTPLSSIQHEAGMLKSNCATLAPDEVQAKLCTIEHQSRHMTRLVDDVLNYSSSVRGNIHILYITLPLGKFLREIIGVIGNMPRYTHVIRLEESNLPTQIVTDEKLLRSILTNLLTNAIKFSPNSDHVELRVRRLFSNLEFVIRDFGIGIPDEEQKTIYDPFMRGKNVDNIQGTGLGLPIVKKSVELLNGTLAFESCVDQGTTFTVTIPLTREQ
jgi:PAS domain S-box-containing protein